MVRFHFHPVPARREFLFGSAALLGAGVICSDAFEARSREQEAREGRRKTDLSETGAGTNAVPRWAAATENFWLNSPM